MIYQIKAVDYTGEEISRLQRGTSDQDAIGRFLERWTEFGDQEPTNIRIDQRWSEQTK